MTIEGQTLDASKIIGITFRNGKSTEWPGGGSMHFSGTNIKIKFENCVWESNYITQNEGGGAVNIRDGATPSFTSCIFKNNYADHTDNSQGNCGAVNIQWANNSNELNDAITFKKTQFINNFAKSKRSSYGGAVATQRSTTFENCLFINNKAITTNDQGYNWYSVFVERYTVMLL